MSVFRNDFERTVWAAAFATTNLVKGADPEDSAIDCARRGWSAVIRLRAATLEPLVDNELAIYALREAQREDP